MYWMSLGASWLPSHNAILPSPSISVQMIPAQRTPSLDGRGAVSFESYCACYEILSANGLCKGLGGCYHSNPSGSELAGSLTTPVSALLPNSDYRSPDSGNNPICGRIYRSVWCVSISARHRPVCVSGAVAFEDASSSEDPASVNSLPRPTSALDIGNCACQDNVGEELARLSHVLAGPNSTRGRNFAFAGHPQTDRS
ncbi:hypothetical protein OBBRIDRAFT_257940 [Obba rivulosa]|uniref:Uncharacterized protein n=1 Tax=Obba rivulosa TaxID=1052685 RepID=A0A8E2ASY9_9APHY|nr:hypothetical protein OBBRIDRAFT_257940 [Obba rivulosa]